MQAKQLRNSQVLTSQLSVPIVRLIHAQIVDFHFFIGQTLVSPRQCSEDYARNRDQGRSAQINIASKSPMETVS